MPRDLRRISWPPSPCPTNRRRDLRRKNGRAISKKRRNPVLKSSNLSGTTFCTFICRLPRQGLMFPVPRSETSWVLFSGGSMWGNKKPDTPQRAQPAPASPITNQTPQPQPQAAPAPASWEEKPVMATDAMRPLGASGGSSSARLGSSLHVKGEITGSEDLQIDGSVEGLIQLD